MTAHHVAPVAMLLAEHQVIEEKLDGALDALDTAIASDGAEAPVQAALETMADVCAYLAKDLTNHIAKEEDVLFPPLRELTGELDELVDDMLAQHAAVRERRDNLEQVLAALDHAHEEVQTSCEAVVRSVLAAGAAPGKDALSSVRLAVHFLEGMLLGHFDDEEENLFPPAEELLPGDVVEDMVRRMIAIDAGTTFTGGD